jgi:hypothetical protein
MRRHVRTLTIFDAMTLVAVTAVGFAIARICLLQIMPRSSLAFAVRLTAVYVALGLTITLVVHPELPCANSTSTQVVVR